MGILDDAIRQHLELKRQGGADPSAVARLEHEAFGPIEREEALEVAEPAPDVAEPAPDVKAAAAEPEPPRMASEPAPVVEEAPTASGSARFDPDGERTVEFSAVEPEPRAESRPPVEPAPPAPEPAAAAEADPQPDAEPGEHDELEETPEFLQETPEHDRLWFEQKPPRDFDF